MSVSFNARIADERSNRVMNRQTARTFIGTAGWGISHRYDEDIPPGESHLQRYCGVFNCTEIDTSFYRSHKRATYARWAATVGENFRFAVKTPRALTHEGELAYQDVDTVQTFASQVGGLGKRLRVVVVQTPPSLEFAATDAQKFFKLLRSCFGNDIAIVCEPRNETWSSAAADQLLKKLTIGRVAADPPRWDTDGSPGGNRQIGYWRLHGTPRTYYSAYTKEQLDNIVAAIEQGRRACKEVWCIFDNTAHGHAIANALSAKRRIAN